ncbi:NACHT, LRR and PYD domains-containing protein 5-like isoform X3 [Mesocricetus auratus]|uniref:NACHT, LRR and PYD domains-containing protein 5-like isoform X3 n=2 Tax=Mesocricetus auratus TaxID=10036 RepID=A0ABM2WNX5_MESAU|nr:NACHT, LRR and PYD domains-containing protein 5-like isoform X3 [Mesocricetus auratus]
MLTGDMQLAGEDSMSNLEEDREQIQSDQGPDEGQATEDSMSNPEEDREPIQSDQGPDEGQATGNLQVYKAHITKKLNKSVKVRSDDPEMRVLSEAFKPYQKTVQPHTVVLHGKPGVGKSALARSIILDWAQNKLCRDISYAFLFSSKDRKWTEKSSLAHLISREWPGSQAPVTEIMSKPERLLFVMDDFDSLESALLQEDMRLCKDWEDERPIYIVLYSLLKKALLPKSFILITTTDAGLQKLKSMLVSPLYILVEGLSLTMRKQVVLKNIIDDHRKNQVICSVIGNHWLAEQCQVPSVCLLVCEALKIQEELGERRTPVFQTLTSLYATLVFHQLTPREPSQSCLSQEERGTLMGLCRMAAEGVWSKKSVFYDDDLQTYGLKESEISALFRMNILQVDRSAKRCYVFFHVSLQDFCAALHYVLEGLGKSNQYFCLTKNLRSLTELKQTHFNTHLDGMKRFLFGLMNKDTMRTLEVLLGCSLSPDVKKVLQHWVSVLGQQANATNLTDVLDAFHYLFESQDEEFVCSSLTSFQGVGIVVNQRMDLAVSSYCLQHCQSLETLWVDVRGVLSMEMNIELCPVIHQPTHGKPHITEFWEDFCSVLGTHPKLKHLDLGSSILNEWAMKILCMKLRNPACKVQSVTFKNAEITSGLQYLWMTLISNQNLRHLHLGNILMKEDDIKLACIALRHPKCSLETLRLDSCALTADCYVMLSKLLLSTTSLKFLSLAGNKVTEESMRWLSDALSSSRCGLQKLILDSCDLTPVSCHILASALFSNRTLTHLCLSNNSLRTEEVRRLCQFMRLQECAVQQLILNQCNLTRDTYGFLALMLSHNGKLTHLGLTMNPVEDSGMKLLCDGIKEPTCHLQELDLVDCQLTEDCCADLASVIATKQHLKSLDLGSNDLGDRGVIALCKGLKESGTSLERLGLEACGLTSDCCEELSLALSCNSCLVSLNLLRNDFCTSGMLKLCSAFLHPSSNLWKIGLWKQQYYAEVRRQLEKVQLTKSHMLIDDDWYSFNEDDRNWWRN